MSLERRLHRRRERLGLYATNDHLRCLGKNFTVVAFMHAAYEKGIDDGYDRAADDYDAQLQKHLWPEKHPDDSVMQ